MDVPAHQWKPEFGNKKVVVKLVKALYGHPQAGAFWEQRANEALKEAGFLKIGECSEWNSVFYHPDHKTMLMVYVDDFKMSGPPEGVKASWDAIKAQQEWNNETGEWEQAVVLGDVEDVNHFLGCDHKVSQAFAAYGTK